MDDGALGLFLVYLLVVYGVRLLFFFFFFFCFVSFSPSWSLLDVIRASESLNNCNSQA